MIKIEQKDYLDFLKDLKSDSINFICIDPPYGKINNMQLQGQKEKVNWDFKINWKELFTEFNRVLKKGGTIAVFGQNPTYSEMILANKEQYRYEYVWIKNNCAQGFHSKIMPLTYTENIAIFIKNGGNRIFNTRYIERKEIDKNEYFNRWYAQQILNFIGQSRTKIHKELGHRKLEFYFYFTGLHFNLLSEKLYNDLIEKYNLEKMKNFVAYDILKEIWEKERGNNIGNKFKAQDYSNTFSNVLEFKKDNDYYHPTQKPIKLIEFLIQTYSNENDLVLDCFLGSGTTALASKNLNRNFIGTEINENYVKIIKERLK